MAKTYEMDMTSGSLYKKILLFAIPLALSSFLQLLFNAADVMVVGRFAGENALAAVGSTGSLVNLLVNMFMGLSVGASVLVSRYFAARDEASVQETVHTAIAISLVSGIALAIIGNIFAGILLRLMGSPENVLPLATLYLRLYFLGMPASMVYNFGSAILRAVGDTKRPLYYLTLAGVVNVVLNLIFVIVFHMSVAGVAIATVISQCVSASLILLCLMSSNSMVRLNIRWLHFDKDKTREIIQTGLPAGIQGCVFSLSNVVIQSSVNAFGAVTMAGCAAASNIEGFVYTTMNAFYQACISFTSQNIGGRRYGRINKVLAICVGYAVTAGVVFGGLAYLFAEPLLGLYNSNPEVIAMGIRRMTMVCLPYFICGIMDVMVGSLRGMGYSFVPMIASIVGACGLRLLWVLTIFPQFGTLEMLFISYPITWGITGLVHLCCFFFVRKKYPKKDMVEVW